jgi:predicted NBD/HSP70 family sugar kinase
MDLPGTRSGRDLTRTAVLALLGRIGPASRAEIASELGISPATVTQVTRRLLEQGMLQALDYAASRGGRPGQLLGLVGAAGRAVGVKVAADHLVVVDVRLDGTVLTSQTMPFDAMASDAIGWLASVLRPVTSSVGGPPLLGVGIGVPGIVDRPDEGNVDAAVLGWSASPLGRHLRGALGLPVLVENDVKAMAVAEILYGRGRTLDDFLVVTIGRGVGLAVVADGSVYRGARGGAGELGHVVEDPGGPRCACGKRGCLEASIGGEALANRGRAAGVLGPAEGHQNLAARAAAGNAAARGIYAEAGRRLGSAVGALITVLDPQMVIIAGEGTSAWPYWEPGFHDALSGHRPGAARDVPVEVEPWDDTSWAQGAAALVLATPFDLNGLAGHQTGPVLARLNEEQAPGRAGQAPAGLAREAIR